MTETGSLVCTRLGVEVAASVDWGGLGPFARLSRLALEVAGRYPGRDVLVQPRLTRLGVEVAAVAGGDSPFRVTRLGVEVAGDAPPGRLLLTRLGTEVAADTPKPPFRLTRLGVEVAAARPGVTVGGDEPLILPFYVHNWAHKLEIETSFQTDVSRDPENSGRERRSRLSKPVRIVTPHWNPDITNGAYSLLWDMMRMGNNRLLIPIYSDVGRITQNSSGTFLHCDTRLRRLFPGFRVLIYRRDPITGEVSSVISRIIASKSDHGITLTQSMGVAPTPTGWRVVPAMLCEVSLEQTAEFLTDGVADFTPSFEEAHGSTALRVTQDGEGGIWPLHLGHAVFTTEVNWASPPKIGFLRPGSSSEQGKGTAVSLLGPRPEFVQEVTIDCKDRQESWDVLVFLESRRGRARSFWHPIPVPLCTNSNIVSVSADEIELSAVPRVLNLQDFLSAVAIRTRDGEVHVARVDSIAQGIDSVTISLLDTLPGDLEVSQIKKLQPCILSCLGSDSFTEIWNTDGVASFSFISEELPREEKVPTPDLSEERTHVEPVGELLLFLFQHLEGF